MFHTFEAFMKEKILVFIGFIVALLFAYRNCFSIDIPTDSYTLMMTFREFGWRGALENFYDVGMAPFADTVIFILYKLIGTNSTGWIITSLLLHTVNAFLVFFTAKSFFRITGIEKIFVPSLTAGVLFLLSPYQTEVLLWAPRMFNYHIATMLFIASFYFLIQAMNDTSFKPVVWLHVFFSLAILSFESPLVFPFAGLSFYILAHIGKITSMDAQRFLLRIFLPQMLILAGYFLLCRIWIGQWILHYGASTHMVFSIPLMITNLVKYLAKFFLFWRYLPDNRSELLALLHIDIRNSVTAILIAVAVLGLIGFLIYRKSQGQKRILFSLFILFFFFMISLLPVINLDTSFVGAIISDRYGYLPSVSFYLFVPLFIYFLFGKFRLIGNALFILIAVYCLGNTIPQWTQADRYCSGLIRNAEPVLRSEGKIYVLNMPDNYNWVLNFRNAFNEYFALKGNLPLTQRVETVAGFFVHTPSDSVIIEADGPGTYSVRSSGGEQKFLNHGLWGKDFSTPEYSVSFNENCSAYQLRFNPNVRDPVLVYIAGDQWRFYKMNP